MIHLTISIRYIIQFNYGDIQTNSKITRLILVLHNSTIDKKMNSE